MASDGEPESAKTYWRWDGSRWIPAHSDGTFRWTGTAWVPVGLRGKAVARLWDPPWRSNDSLRLLAWLIVAPTMIAAVVIGLWKMLSLDATQLVVAGLAGYATWASVGGTIVRPHGRFREVAIITAIVLLVLIAVPSEWFAAADENKHGGHGQDIAAGFGIAFLFIVALPPTLALAAAGRLGRRLVRRSRLPG